MYVLIDTCSWIDLLSETKENKVLTFINFFVKNKDIEIIIHEKVIEEWNEHKIKEKKKFTDSLRTKYKHANEIIKRESLQVPNNLEPNLENIEEQIKTIDELLNDAILIRTPNHIKGYTADRAIAPRKAPFHNNVDSIKDAYIIFSTLDYCKQHGIYKLFFISSNKSEFGDPSNKERKIHHELVEDYRDITIDYYSEIGRAINDLRSKFPTPRPEPVDTIQPKSNIITVVKEETEVVIDKAKPILEQINEYISFQFKEVNNIPIHLLTRSYPFKKEDSFFPYYSVFSLSTDNEELFEFFESIKIKKNSELIFTKKELIKGVKNHEEVSKTVLTKLSENLIFNLESKKSHKRINIHYREEQKCNCVSCRFFRFEFSEAFKMLSTIPVNLDKKYKLAYVQYQIGNFLEAEKLFSELDNQSKSKHLNIRQFIAQYNQNKLSIFIRDRYWDENAQDALVEKLKEINLDKLFKDLVNPDNEKLLNWIKSNSFYTKSRDKIQKTANKIREHYYSQLQGGWSSNNYIWELINEYAEIDAFLNNNYIIYDGFREFMELTEVFIEGLFASHAINKTQNSRLESFDDWLVKKIVFYGKAERILKHFERYGLKEIIYKQTSNEGDSFVELLSRFLDGYTKTRKAFNQYCEKNNRYFWERYNSIFSNLMVMAGISDLRKPQVNKIAEKLFKFLEIEKSIYPYSIRYARFFINRKSNLINKSTLKKFLLSTISNGKLHGKDFIKAVAIQIKGHHGKIKLAANDYTKFEKMAFDKCPICKRKHSANFMVYLYEVISDEKTRDKIKLGIEKSLKNKYSTELYSLSAIFGILEAKGDFFEQFIQASKPVPNQTSFKSIFTGKDEIRHPNLNMLINLCYKYNIDLDNEKFEAFKGIDAYYDWLLNMKNFDYSLFNPKWVSEYKTLFYSMEIRKYKIIQEKICEYLKDNHDPQLERDYIDLFCDDKG